MTGSFGVTKLPSIFHWGVIQNILLQTQRPAFLLASLELIVSLSTILKASGTFANTCPNEKATPNQHRYTVPSNGDGARNRDTKTVPRRLVLHETERHLPALYLT